MIVCALGAIAVPRSVFAFELDGINLGSEGDGSGLSLALTAEEQPAAAFINPQTGAVVYTEFDGSSWNGVILATGYFQGGDTALVIAAGNPHVFYYNTADNQLSHSVRVSGSWSTEVISTTIDIGGELSAAACGGGLCISLYDEASGVLRVFRGSTGSWSGALVDGSANDVGAMNDIAAGPDGAPVVVYYDATAKRLKLAAESSGAWTVQTVDYMGSNIGVHPRIAVTLDGSYHLSYSRYTSAATAGDTAAYYARKAPGGSWEFSVVSDDYSGGGTDIAINGSGLPVILFRYLRFSESAGNYSSVALAELLPSGIWSIQLLPPELGGEGAEYSFSSAALVLRPGGTPIAAYGFSRGPLLGLPASARFRMHGEVSEAFLDSDGGSGSSSSSSSSTTTSSSGESSSSTTTSSSSETSSSTTTSSSGGTSSSSTSSSGSSSSSSSTSSSGGETDSDGDGLTDEEELLIGTDPFNPDHDNDGVTDGQEVLDSSNPLDRGSSIQVLGTRICSEWNGYLGGLWNVYEHINVSTGVLNVVNEQYAIDGVMADSTMFSIAPGSQYDALVHSYRGLKNNSYGMVCAVHSGFPGDMDGRMVYYKPVKSAGETVFEFAFAMPMMNGKKGSQYVQFNTYQPSFRQADQGNLVANWIQLTNLSDEAASGVLEFFDITGFLLARLPISLAGGERRDYAGHQWGPNQVGYAEWRPDSQSSRFQLRNVRYLYDNRGNRSSFATAFQLEARHGTGEPTAAPYSTEEGEMAVVEVSNTTAASIVVKLDIFSSANGFTQALPQTLTLGPRQTQHVILNNLVGDGVHGAVFAESDTLSSALAVVMQYRRDAQGGIEYMYGVPLKQALGQVLRGSYNTYLNQQSVMVLLNRSDGQQTVQFQLVRSSGEAVVSANSESYELVVPANGSARFDISLIVGPDDYGVVTAIPKHSNTIVGHILRRRGLEYVMPTPLRQ